MKIKKPAEGFVIRTAWCGSCWWHVQEQFPAEEHPLEGVEGVLQRQHDGAGRNCTQKIHLERSKEDEQHPI